jgi:plasmid maintenance system antidote protein VapI
LRTPPGNHFEKMHGALAGYHSIRVDRPWRLFGNAPDFWLNVQRRGDLRAAVHSPRERERIRRARPLRNAA